MLMPRPPSSYSALTPGAHSPELFGSRPRARTPKKGGPRDNPVLCKLVGASLVLYCAVQALWTRNVICVEDAAWNMCRYTLVVITCTATSDVHAE